MNNRTELIYVWLGSQAPIWTRASVEFTKTNNPTLKTVLITNQHQKGLSNLFDQIVILETDEILAETGAKLRQLKGGSFWKFTSLRFSALNAYLKRQKVESFIHLEIDNLAANLSNAIINCDKLAKGLFAPRDSDLRGIGSIIYCNLPQSIGELINYYEEPWLAKNDMEALGLFLKYNPLGVSLPTESFQENSQRWDLINPNHAGFIFDAAAIGQYCLGIDPKSTNENKTYNLFKNENSRISWDDDFQVRSNGNFLEVKSNNNWLPLANLHVHSKDIELAIKLVKGQGTLLSNLQKKKKVLMQQTKVDSRIQDLIIQKIRLIFTKISKKALKKLAENNYGQAFISKIQDALIEINYEEEKPRISSYPYLSGDFFMNLSDKSILKKQEFCRLHNTNEIIFVEGDMIDKEWVLKECIKFRKVIVHNSDDTISERCIEKLTTHGCYIFATNIQKGVNIEPIPIGIENAWLRNNGSIHFYNQINLENQAFINNKKQEVLVSFSIRTNQEVRAKYQNICESYGFENTPYSTQDYRKALQRSYFVICPPGNGIDCHRNWEAMYTNTVPVIEKKYYLFEHHNLPVLICEDLENDFLKLSKEEKLKKYNEITGKVYPAIYADYWIRSIKK